MMVFSLRLCTAHLDWLAPLASWGIHDLHSGIPDNAPTQRQPLEVVNLYPPAFYSVWQTWPRVPAGFSLYDVNVFTTLPHLPGSWQGSFFAHRAHGFVWIG